MQWCLTVRMLRNRLLVVTCRRWGRSLLDGLMTLWLVSSVNDLVVWGGLSALTTGRSLVFVGAAGLDRVHLLLLLLLVEVLVPLVVVVAVLLCFLSTVFARGRVSRPAVRWRNFCQ